MIGRRVMKRGLRVTVATLVAGLGTLTAIVVPAAVAGAAADVVTSCSGSASVSGSLPYVVAHASPGDTINFSLAPSCTTISLANTITISNNVTIAGPGAGSLAVSGHGAVGVFAVTRAATVTISGLTIENGSNSGGGGINNQGTLTVVNSVLTHNSSPHGDGGAIYNHGSQGAAQATLTVTGSTISSNSVSGGFAGGGIANDGSASIGTSTLSTTPRTTGRVRLPTSARR